MGSPDVVAAFARHETFHPRYGWLKKGFDAADLDPQIFLREDAALLLGVGKNMVRAIRYWCHATKVLEEIAGVRGAGSIPTEFGRQLLGNRGFDPFLEDIGSLWLLHWKLLSPKCIATAWYFAFNRFVRQQFNLEDLNVSLSEYATREFGTARLAASSLRKDTSCITRMYVEVPMTGAVGEDSIQCPFAELSLLRQVAPKMFAFNIGTKPGLSFMLVAAAALEFAGRIDSNARTASLSTLLHAEGSPGLIFRLSESALYSALENAAEIEPALALTDAGGLIQLSFTDRPRAIAEKLIKRHYRASRADGAVQ